MRVKYHKRFLKELSKIPSKNRTKIEDFAFNEIPQSESIYQIGRLEKMKGYSSYYKVRFGVYRVGIRIEGDTVIFERVLHRKDLYRYFPTN